MIIPHSKELRIRGAADRWQFRKSRYAQPLDVPPQSQEFTDVVVNCMRRIEAILRNGLPHSDKNVTETIEHAHSEVEKALEDISPDWWMS